MENGKTKIWLPAIRSEGGAGVYTRRLAALLERGGFAAQITWFPPFAELLPALLMHERPPSGTDLIIANSWNAFAFRRHGLPLVAVVHHCTFDPALRPYKSLPQNLYHDLVAAPREARSLRVADAVVAVSHHVAGHLRKRHGFEGAEVIYNWVDMERFSPAPHESYSVRPFRLLSVGKPTRLKGGDLLAPLMSRLGEGFELAITATPEACRSIGLSSGVIPLGHLTEQEMIYAYQNSDAVLVPSRAEGFGYAALEAMACGKPVIASNTTALPELVQNGVNGILCTAGDIKAYANACRQLASDLGLCLSMGRAGRRCVLHRFSEETAVASYLGLICRLVML